MDIYFATKLRTCDRSSIFASDTLPLGKHLYFFIIPKYN